MQKLVRSTARGLWTARAGLKKRKEREKIRPEKHVFRGWGRGKLCRTL